MPLPFSLVCELLDESHRLCIARKTNRLTVESWFIRHRTRIDAHDTNLAALLSTLLPDKRTDRVYCIQATALEKIVGRGLSLGASRILELARHRQPGTGVDLADCVGRILTVTPNPVFTENQVTVEQVDQLLHGLASGIKWSSPAIRASQTPLTQRNRGDLERIFSRVTATEAKWLTRLVLKSFAPLIFDEHLILMLCDPLLPSVLKVQEDFASAVNLVQSMRHRLPPNSGARESTHNQLLAKVKPKPGTKVGRQHWVKGRSIKHCLDQARGRVSVENKVDGEYCQIHIDLSKGSQCVQIFSKSGKDSTEDRERLHSIIKKSLKVHKPDCGFSKACIVEGELVVYSDLTNKILPFHKIRNHVTRRGLFLNTEQDSLPTAHEHLMIVYYDILLLDDESLLGVRHSERFKILTSLVECQKGWAELVQREVIDFDHSLAASNLRRAFAKTIVDKREGLVLKPDEPFFEFTESGRPWSGRCIKLKKEYIGNFGDVGDFAAVGAGYDPVKAKHYNISNLKWTHFYIGCLDNKEEVKRWSSKPEFTVINIVELNETQLKSVVQFSNPLAVSRDNNEEIKLNMAPGVEGNPCMSVVFTNPMVFDLRCFNFDKVGNTGFWSPRFPMVSKVHFDRDFTDTVSFEQLQDLAKEATKAPELPDSQENLQWIARLEGADPKGIPVDTVSQQTSTTMPTPSPCRSTPNASSQGWSQSPLAARKPVRLVTPQLNVNHPEENVAGESAPSKLPLTTPPTSSEPTEQSLKQHIRNRSQKRSPPPSSKPSQNRKKRKSGEIHPPPIPPSQHPNMSQPRKPLAETDANTSHRSITSLPMDSQPMREPELATECEVIDLTSSTDGSWQTTVKEVGSWQTASSSSQESEETSVFPPENGGNHEQQATSLPSSQISTLQSAGELEHPSPSSNSRTGCIHSGSQCQFAKTTVLLAPHLNEPHIQVSALLSTHGINDVVRDIKAWMADPQRRMEKVSILLVDSVKQEGATKKLLELMEDYRNNIPGAKRDEIITVYDWRVMEYITIMEDDNITKKYYDGFKSPWRRWYCGLI